MRTLVVRGWRIMAGLIAAAALALALAGCSYGYPHACDGHGGIRFVYKGIYKCEDGSHIGGGWLLFHPHDPRAQP